VWGEANRFPRPASLSRSPPSSPMPLIFKHLAHAFALLPRGDRIAHFFSSFRTSLQKKKPPGLLPPLAKGQTFRDPFLGGGFLGSSHHAQASGGGGTLPRPPKPFLSKAFDERGCEEKKACWLASSFEAGCIIRGAVPLSFSSSGTISSFAWGLVFQKRRKYRISARLFQVGSQTQLTNAPNPTLPH